MGTKRKPEQRVPTQDAENQDATRKRQALRAAAAFQRRAEASERRWLGGLSIGGKARSR